MSSTQRRPGRASASERRRARLVECEHVDLVECEVCGLDVRADMAAVCSECGALVCVDCRFNTEGFGPCVVCGGSHEVFDADSTGRSSSDRDFFVLGEHDEPVSEAYTFSESEED